jgi:predicted nucleic acid-binding protein
MPDINRASDVQELVINTGPLLALIAALGDLEVLQLYQNVWVPFEVRQEILAGGATGFGVAGFRAARWLNKQDSPLEITPILNNTLDRGEAAVIQFALNEAIQTVCIDEAVGRRVARLHNLSVTGSVGILLRAQREGYAFSMREVLDRMQAQGVWLSERVVAYALAQAGET